MHKGVDMDGFSDNYLMILAFVFITQGIIVFITVGIMKTLYVGIAMGREIRLGEVIKVRVSGQLFFPMVSVSQLHLDRMGLSVLTRV